MFYVAQSEIKDWTISSRCNKGLSKGFAFNILSCGVSDHDFLVKPIHILAKINMIREFGEFLPNYQPTPTRNREKAKVQHQPPKFLQ